MDKNASEHYQLELAENHLIKTDKNKTKLDDGHQNISGCNNYEDKSFFMLCMENGVKQFRNVPDENIKQVLMNMLKKLLNIFVGKTIYIYQLVSSYDP